MNDYNDDKLAELFAGYNPEMESDTDFMRQLRGNIRAIEAVREQMCLNRRHQRWAMGVAAVVGFCFGVVAAIYYPVLLTMAIKISGSFPNIADFVIDYGNLLVLGIYSIIGTGIVYLAYDLTDCLAGEIARATAPSD